MKPSKNLPTETTGHADAQEPKAESMDLQPRTSKLRSDTEGHPKVARCSLALISRPSSAIEGHAKSKCGRDSPASMSAETVTMSSETATNVDQIGAGSLPLSRQSRGGAQSQNPPRKAGSKASEIPGL